MLYPISADSYKTVPVSADGRKTAPCVSCQSQHCCTHQLMVTVLYSVSAADWHYSLMTLYQLTSPQLMVSPTSFVFGLSMTCANL